VVDECKPDAIAIRQYTDFKVGLWQCAMQSVCEFCDGHAAMVTARSLLRITIPRDILKPVR